MVLFLEMGMDTAKLSITSKIKLKQGPVTLNYMPSAWRKG